MKEKKPDIKKIETIGRIYDAAKRIFAENGFAGARVDEIAKQAGINKAMIYYHVGNKEALYAAVLHNVFADAVKRMNKHILNVCGPEERLKAYIKNIIAMVDNHSDMVRIMMREIASEGKHFPETLGEDLSSIFETLTGILDEGKQQGVFGAVTPLIIHMMIIGTVIFYKMTGPVRLQKSTFPEKLRNLDGTITDAVAEEIETLVMNALGRSALTEINSAGGRRQE